MRCVIVLLAASLAACGAAPPRPPAPRPAAPSGSAESVTNGSSASGAPTAGDVYRIDPENSELRVLVYRAGPMAALGHNHVIINRSLAGWTTFDGDPQRARFEVTVPAAGFVVDDAAARKAEGADFAEDVDEDAKAGTLHNMRGAGVLDADRYPAITVRSTGIMGGRGEFQATVAITVAGHESTLVVPVTVESLSGRLSGSGELTVRQTDLGLTPFSVFLGALRVEDQLRIKYHWVAVR